MRPWLLKMSGVLLGTLTSRPSAIYKGKGPHFEQIFLFEPLFGHLTWEWVKKTFQHYGHNFSANGMSLSSFFWFFAQRISQNLVFLCRSPVPPCFLVPLFPCSSLFPFSPCFPCSPSFPVTPVSAVALVPSVPPCSPVPLCFPCSPLFPLFPCSPVPVPLFLFVSLVSLFPFVSPFPLFPPCFPCSPVPLCFPCSPVPRCFPCSPCFPLSLFPFV